MIALFFIVTLALLMLGAPVAIALGLPSAGYILLQNIPSPVVIQKVFGSMDSVALLAIPLFILAGDLMNKGGIAKRMIRLANAVVADTPGGLAIVAIMGCMFFAAISGSGIATAAAMGSIMIPPMLERGYDKGFSSAVIGAASPVGVIIPPSITFVLYGVTTETSITSLYKAGIPAGLIIGTALILVAFFISKKRGYRGADQKFNMKEFTSAFLDGLVALGTPIIMIGGVFAGIMTPTESAAVAVIYAIIVGMFVYKDLKLNEMLNIIKSSAITAAEISFIVAGATIFSYVLAYERIPQMMVEFFLGISSNKIILLIIINAIMLFAGCFMNTSAIILIFVPMFFPVVTALGVDPVHFGIMTTINTAIGMITPPFGVCLFTTSGISNVSIQDISKEVIPFLVAMILILLLITFVPQTIMFLL
jgi:C4-dicarboxylate transporter DctM subunit